MRDGKRGVMTEDNSRPPSICSPEADCNSNNTVLDNVTTSQVSNTSSHEGDLNPDTNEYQWFLDFGLKDGGNRYQTSIFSLSPLHQDLTYDDLAKNIDANLAEIDMENFRSEDIHSILALPAMFCGDFESHKHGEQFASMSGSLMAKFDALDSSLTPKSSSQGSTKDDSDVSMCKSEPLFSPVKEAPLLPSFSVDSLDCESYDEQELMLTCQANKNNYTIAFEGSFTHYSDDSDYHDAGGSEATDSNTWSGQYKLCSNNSVDNSMVQSDFVFTTWSKLKRINDVERQKGTSHTEKNQGRYSENYTAAKSQSLPNLFRKSFSGSEMKLSQLNISIDSDQCVPVYDIQTSQSSHSRASDTSSQQSFSLVRLFIQQKGTNSQDTSVAPSLCQSTSSACMDSIHLPTHFDPLAPTNRPNPNLCMDHSDKMKIVNAKRQTSNSSSLEDLDFVKEDIVSRQKNLMSENEKGTNVSGPLSPVHLLGSNTRHKHETKDDSEGSHCHKERTRSRCRLFHMGNANLEDSLTEGRPRSPATSPIEEETEDVEMVSIEEIKVENPKDIERNKENKEKEATDTSGICNNAVDPTQPSTFWDPRPSGVDVINNFFPSCKSNTCQTNLALIGAEDKLGWKDDLSPISLSQGTQTKRFNSKESSPVEPPGVRSPQSDLHQEVLNNARRNQVHERGENNSSSGCHTNNRNSRLRRNSPGFINNTQNEGMQTLRRRLNVTITTMRSFGTQIPVHVIDQAVQTSLVDDLSNKPSFTIHEEVADKATKVPSPEPSQIIDDQNCNKTDDKVNNTSKEKFDKKSVYVYYPNYSLPDLSFLKSSLSSSLNSARMFLMPQTLKSSGTNTPPNRRASRPHSCPDVDSLRRQNFGHIKDWDSLSVLLPREVRNILIGSSDAPDPSKDIPNFCRSRPETRTPRGNKEPSSASANDHVPPSALNHMFVYRYDGSDAEGPEFIHPPPLPKRSISLPRSGSSENEAPKSPLPKGILRKPSPSRTGRDCGIYSKRYSMSDFSAYKFPNDLTLKRLSLQEPWEFLVNPNEETCIQKDNPVSMEPQPCNSSIILSPKNIKKPPETVHVWAAKPDNSAPSLQNIDKTGAEKGQEKVTCSSKKFMKTNNTNNKVETNYFIQHSNQNFDSEQNKDVKTIVTEPVVKTSPDLAPTAPSASPEFQCSLNSSCEHQVSCTCSCDRNRSKKSVSFSENVAVQESPTPEGMSPSNSPEGSLQAAHHPLAREVSEAQRVYSSCHTGCSIHNPVYHSPINEDIEAESPPQEFSVSPPHGSSPANSLHLSEPVSFETSSATDNTRHMDLNQKKALVLAVNNAVDVIVSLFSSVKDPQEKYKLGSSSLNPVIGHKVLQWLCPAMFSVLSDGLQPALYSFFGRIQNSVWRVIEASSQLGPSTRALNDLVIRLNSEESLKEEVTKFNAFIFGLLNIRSLDSWLAFLRTRENLLQKYYHGDAFLYLSNSATRNLFDDLLVALQPLSVLPFELDLLFEASMKNSMDQLTPYLQSIPSVTRCLNEEDDNQQFNCLLYHQDTIQQQGTVGKETKDYHNQQARQACRTQGDILKQIYDEQLPSATSDVNEVPVLRNGKDFVTKGKPLLQRHRSCVENSANGFSLADIASNVKKRWSGIQFGSRLIQAFDKMLLDQQWNSNSFCEHLDSPAFWETQSSNDSTPTSPDYCLQKLPHSDENPDISTCRPKPEGSADIPESHSEPYHLEAEMLSNPEKMGSEFVSNHKSNLSANGKPNLAEQLPSTTLKAKENSELAQQNKQARDEGIQFKQLQMKWEQMSAKPEKKNNNININNNCNNTGGSGGRSRIPRLVPSSSRQHKMDDSAISLRSSASGQSSNGQDGSRERLGIQEARDGKQEDSNKIEPEHKPVSTKLIETRNKSDIAKPFVQKLSDTPSPRRKVPLPRQGGKSKTVNSLQEIGSAPNKRLYSPKKQKLGQAGKAISKLSDLSEMQKQNIEGTYDSHFLSTRKVKTLCHHLATDSDQLTYSKGETLTVWTEVDSDWLLCSRGQERGLVSKLCVIKTNDN